MLFKSFIAAAAGLAVLPSVLAITITGPDPNHYWVFGVANNITWTYEANDPTPVSITITNPNNTILNGVFSIAENVPVSQQSFTVTDVTLRPGTGYIVNFINPSNNSQVYTSSSAFTVDPQGTAPYGEELITTVSVSVSGTVTRSYTITETSFTGVPAATGTGNGTVAATGTSGTTTSTGIAAATATVETKTKTGGATSFKFGTPSTLMGVVGALFGAVAVL